MKNTLAGYARRAEISASATRYPDLLLSLLVILYKKMIEALTVLNFNVSSAVNSSSLIPRGTNELKEDDGLMVRYFSSFSLGK